MPTRASRQVYQNAPGFIGPLTYHEVKRRFHREISRTRKAERRRLAAICENSPDRQHRWVPWDCACTFGCDCCSLNAECSLCGAKR